MDIYDDKGLEVERTEDIKHDLAMMYAETFPRIRAEFTELQKEYEAELIKRGEPLPIDCQWVYCPYSMGKQKLVYS